MKKPSSREGSAERVNVYAIFKRTNLDSVLLSSIFEILNFNFFELLAADLDKKRDKVRSSEITF